MLKRGILTVFMVVAGIGLVLSLVVHVCSLLGLSSPLGQASWTLHVGIFIVWLPAVLVSNKLTKDFKQNDFWKAALRACPKWMRRMVSFFFVYAIVNFIIFMIFMVGKGTEGNGESETPSIVFRGFSGHWMAFYSAAVAILYSAIHVHEHDNARRCPNGHPISASATFCEECGEKIIEGECQDDFQEMDDSTVL